MTKPSFSARKKARRFALQALYSWMMSDNDLRDIEIHFLTEHSDVKFDIEYFRLLLHEIPPRITELENNLNPFLDRSVEDLDPIELTILRMAVYELLFRLDIPYRVVINEALELAKTFGAVDSYKFVNGVLDKIAKKVRKD